MKQLSPTNADSLVVAGHRIAFTNLGKVLYPETGTTKSEILSYYAAVASVFIEHASWRPATRKRWVHGVGTSAKPEQSFFQKRIDTDAPAWIKRFPIEHSDHVNLYPVVNDAATLLWLAQRAALEIHVTQWQFGPRGKRRNPDRLVLDLDPGPGAELAECAIVALAARALLQDIGLDCIPVTSGSKGIHMYAGLDGKQTSDQVSLLAHEIARALENELPDLVVSDMKKSLRDGKVLVDWSQNSGAKTTIAPYSLRGRSMPTVAAPRLWREIDASLTHLTFDQIVPRLESIGDPLALLVSAAVAKPMKSVKSAEPIEGEPDRLAAYRSKRNAERTSEPIPDTVHVRTKGTPVFVIQEHHASRLHFDLRLEHEGVLVSWAIPRGVPTDGKKNHLAVQTEDHPMEYRTFEGSIPKGEYGGGEMCIWDSGTYEVLKWTEGKEVIATLQGSVDGGLGGSRTFALIHTGKTPKDANRWLIHLMETSPE